MLQQLVDLNIQIAEALGYADTPYDALLDQYEPGMPTATVARLFEELKQAQIPMIHAMAEQQDRIDNSVLRQEYAEALQAQFGEAVARDLGYDFERGRLDVAVHPFTTGFGSNDVRITTRYQDHDLLSGLTATMHEGSHALYEQGLLFSSRSRQTR